MGLVRSMMAALTSGLWYPPGSVSTRVQAAWGRSAGAEPDATEPWYGEYPPAGVEPPLAEVLGDPIVHLLMRADHLVPGEVLPVTIVAKPAALRVDGRSMLGGS